MQLSVPSFKWNDICTTAIVLLCMVLNLGKSATTFEQVKLILATVTLVVQIKSYSNTKSL